jgi:hypothetical protein
LPSALHIHLRFESKRKYQYVKDLLDMGVSPIADFFSSLFELALASADLARELLDEMKMPMYLPDCSGEKLRAIVTATLVAQTQKELTIENYRSLTQILELCIRRFDWPLDLLNEGECTTSLIAEGKVLHGD